MGIPKKELLKMVDDAITLEDRSVPVYNRHLKTALFWSGLPAADREKLRIQLGILEKESERHSRSLGELRKKIEENPKNVF